MEDQLQAVEDQEVLQFVCFRLANEEYAVKIIDVQEVIRIHKITPLPQVQDFCLGVINLRGNVISVFDMRKKLHLPVKEFDIKTKIIVARVENETFSMIVDEILENIKLENHQIDSAPAIKMKIDKECVAGIGELEGRMITILNLKRLLDDIKKVMIKAKQE